jgi:aspartate/methionine/tyrosine aminotransferase
MEKDLTQTQIRYLPETFNFTDGHAHRPFDKSERQAIGDLNDLFVDVEREQHLDLERVYMEAFYSLHRQTLDTTNTKYLLLPSASMSLEVVANYVRLAGIGMALIEPCFDNLANMFKRHNIPLEPFPDHWLEEAGFAERLQQIHSKAICLVSPNNPTGITCSEEVFRQLVAHCKQHQKLLILDSSFRAYKTPEYVFDEYQLLQESGIDYLVIEDTGKTWPTKELKVSVLAMSPAIHRDVYDIYTDFLYLLSPFTVMLLTNLVRNAAATHMQAPKSIVSRNRKELYATLKGSPVVACEKPFNSVAWLKVEGSTTAAELNEALKANGLFILPGRKFFWSEPSKGDAYLRIALARDPEQFTRAMKKFRQALQDLGILDSDHAVSSSAPTNSQ